MTNTACPVCAVEPNQTQAQDLEEFLCIGCGLPGLWSLERIPHASKEYFTVEWVNPNTDITPKTSWSRWKDGDMA